MPELPEAESIRRALDRALKGRKITAVEVFSPAMRTSLLPLKTAGLPGCTVTGVRRRGRYLVADLDDSRALLMHFGMSGVVRVEPLSVPRRKHEHLFLHLDNGRAFRFECTRRFSLFEVCSLPGSGLWPEKLDSLGVEPLSEDFSAEYLFKVSRNRRTPVKTFIMDNAVVTGIGNIYAAEILFASGIDPRREALSLSLAECQRITGNAVEILQEAIACGGTTVSDFLNVDGTEGKFVQKLAVYSKAGQPCRICGNPLVSCRQGGRTSFFCRKCQK